MPQKICDVSNASLTHLMRIRTTIQNSVYLRAVRNNESDRRLFLIEVALLGEWLTHLRDASNPCIQILQKLPSALYPGQYLLYDIIGLRNISLKRCCYEEHIISNREGLKQIIRFFSEYHESIDKIVTQLQSLLTLTKNLTEKEVRQFRRQKSASIQKPIIHKKHFEFTPSDYLIIIIKEIDSLWDYIHEHISLTEDEKKKLYEDSSNLEPIWDQVIQRHLRNEITLKIIGNYVVNISQMLRDLGDSLKGFSMNEFMIMQVLRDWTAKNLGVIGIIVSKMGLEGTRSHTHFVDMLVKRDIENIAETAISYAGVCGSCITGLVYLKKKNIAPKYFIERESGKWEPVFPHGLIIGEEEPISESRVRL